MMKLLFLLAWRNIVKRRIYSFIEITSIGIGLTSFLLVLFYINYELSYDQFFSKSRQIYRVNHVEQNGNRYSALPPALGGYIRQELPQVKNLVRVYFPYRMRSDNALVQHEEIRFYESEVMEADSTFFKLFDFPFIAGSPRTALSHPQSIVLSERAAKKYFGLENPLGQIITIDNGESLAVTGVVSVPLNTHLAFDFLRPAHYDPARENVWNHTTAFTYLLVEDINQVQNIENQIYKLVLAHSQNQDAEYLNNYRHKLQPLNEVHSTILTWDIISVTPTQQLYAILAISLFVLILGVVNFINLSTARSSERMKEVGINKIMGAEKLGLISQFFTECLLVTFIAGIISIGLAYLVLPYFNTLIGTSLEFEFTNVVYLFLGTILLVSLIAGLYPSYQLAKFQPIQVIKRTHTGGFGKQYLRQALVVFQFVISIGLLSAMLIIQSQIKFMQNKDLGFNKEQVLIMRLRQPSQLLFDQLKNSILTNASISKVAGASIALGGETSSDTFHPDHMPEQLPQNFSWFIAVDYEFLNLMDIPLLAGRNFEKNNMADFEESYIVNETALQKFDLPDPLGANFRRSTEPRGKIIGVIRNFNFESAGNSIQSLILDLDSVRSFNYMYIKINGNIPQAIAHIENAWVTMVPQYPFEYFFLDQYFNQLYKQQEQIKAIVQIFSVLAIFLASLGLLGLCSFMILQRTKEIGIRKVVGATLMNIVGLIYWNFFKLIGISFLISVPLTYYFTKLWLQNFTNRVSINFIIFILAGILIIILSALTIGLQSIKAATADPVKALKQD